MFSVGFPAPCLHRLRSTFQNALISKVFLVAFPISFSLSIAFNSLFSFFAFITTLFHDGYINNLYRQLWASPLCYHWGRRGRSSVPARWRRYQRARHRWSHGCDVCSRWRKVRVSFFPFISSLNEDLLSWQSVDGCDASFMTPTRLKALKTLLGHPDISLLTLNAPQSSMNGVIPLGMAAWLNQPQAVCTLLDDSADSVFVDGMDSHGATALMCRWLHSSIILFSYANYSSDAARDGSLEVVQALVSILVCCH